MGLRTNSDNNLLNVVCTGGICPKEICKSRAPDD